MIDPSVVSILEGLIGPDDKVIDIGGARDPFYRANYVLDKCTYDEMVGQIVYGQDKKHFFTRENWISRNFFELPWPFPDNFFDFAICLGTLEDIRDPISIAKEIQRVSKAGYITTPTRSKESYPFISNRHPKEHGLAGYFHHRWFAEIINGELVFKAKCPFLYNRKDLMVTEISQGTLHYFWHDKFGVREEYFGAPDDAEQDCIDFKRNHNEFLREQKKGNYLTDFYNYWDPNLGEAPDFSNLNIEKEKKNYNRSYYHMIRLKYALEGVFKKRN